MKFRIEVDTESSDRWRTGKLFEKLSADLRDIAFNMESGEVRVLKDEDGDIVGKISAELSS